MRPTTKTELALNGLVALAEINKSNPISLSVLAKEQCISLSYLEQVFSSLKNNGLVKGVRGPGGGYVLAKHPSEITVDEILISIDAGSQLPSSSKEKIVKIEKIEAFWEVMISKTIDLYKGVTLQEIINGTSFFVEKDTETTPQAAE